MVKTVMVQEDTVSSNTKDIEKLKKYSKGLTESFKQSPYQVDGFEFSSKSTDTSFTITTTYDYTKINIKEALKKGKVLLHVTGMIDENYEIPYARVKEAYKILGYEYEEVK